ncbi:anti-sigma factor [Oscillatoria amoena NRMC-F 0135]|nr:anti-sigma factor [Oscillatoria amoena NRMC-F 0135]
MDITEIINSGLLELYVLGLTNTEETKQVDEWRAQFAEVNAEIATIEGIVQSYVQQYDTTPPADLKEKILARLSEEKGINIPRRATLQTRWVQYGMVASVALLIGSVVLNVVYYGRWQDSQKQLARLESEKQELFAQNQTQRTALSSAEGELGILKSPTLKMVTLASVKPNVPAQVTVYWDTAKNNVFVNINNLPPAPADKQYQLWALVDGVPVDAGVMEVDITNLQQLKQINKAQAFAITLEKRGGAVSPTLEEMIVLGTVKA